MRAREASASGKVLPVPGDGLPPVPPELDTPELRTALLRRIAERAEQPRRYHVTEQSLEALYRELLRVKKARGVDHAVRCLDRATTGRHQGVVFPEDLAPGAGGDQGRLFQPRDDGRGGRRPGKKKF